MATLYDTVREGSGRIVAVTVLITTCTEPSGSCEGKLVIDRVEPCSAATFVGLRR